MNLGDQASLKREKQDISITWSRFDDSSDPSSTSSMKSEPAYGTPILSRTTYIHTTTRIRDISIVPSSACCGNNSTGATRHDALYWSSLRARLRRKPGQGSSPLSFFLWLEPPISFSFSQLGSDSAPMDQRVFNYPDKIVIALRFERWWPFILILAGDLER